MPVLFRTQGGHVNSLGSPGGMFERRQAKIVNNFGGGQRAGKEERITRGRDELIVGLSKEQM